MKTKFLIGLSILLNVALIIYVILKRDKVSSDSEVYTSESLLLKSESEVGYLADHITFIADSLNRAAIPSFSTALNLDSRILKDLSKVEKENLISEQKTIISNLERIKEFRANRVKRSKACKPMKEKGSYTFKLGELNLKIKKGDVASVKGINLTNARAKTIFSTILIYDKILCLSCDIIQKIPYSPTPSQMEFLLKIMEKISITEQNFNTYIEKISKAKTESELAKIIEAESSKVTQNETEVNKAINESSNGTPSSQSENADSTNRDTTLTR